MPLPDHDFDTTEVAVPWRLLRDAGHEVVFATEHGDRAPACDPRLLDGVIFGRLGAEPEPMRVLRAAARGRRSSAPRSRGRTIEPSAFDGLLLAGGHAPGMRQYLGSALLQEKVAAFWALERPVGAICHGVLRARAGARPGDGPQRPRRRRARPACPSPWSAAPTSLTAWRLGRYYRTYPAYVEDEVMAALDDPAQFEPGPRSLRRGTATDDDPAFVVAGRALPLGALARATPTSSPAASPRCSTAAPSYMRNTP